MWKIFSVPCGSALYKFHCIKEISIRTSCGIKVVLIRIKFRTDVLLVSREETFTPVEVNSSSIEK
jgi:hypothetical protein